MRSSATFDSILDIFSDSLGVFARRRYVEGEYVRGSKWQVLARRHDTRVQAVKEATWSSGHTPANAERYLFKLNKSLQAVEKDPEPPRAVRP